jgi:hypothetical protein
MSSIKCPSCGLINFAAATICKRCQMPLAAAGQPPSHNLPRFRLPVMTFYGIGISLLDYRPLSADTYEATR